MKKNFKFYVATWAVVLATFNTVIFVVPPIIGNKFTGSFWTAYIFITLAFLGQLACAYLAFKPQSLEKVFLNVPLITISYTGLLVSLIVGTLCMVLSSLPTWIAIVVCYLVLAFMAIALMKANVAAEMVSAVEDKVKAQTATIKMLTADAEHILATAKSTEIKAEAKKVYEAIRYSDPMSKEALADVETRIQSEFVEFENAVQKEDNELVASIGKDLLELIDMRNKKCKMLK